MAGGARGGADGGKGKRPRSTTKTKRLGMLTSPRSFIPRSCSFNFKTASTRFLLIPNSSLTRLIRFCNSDEAFDDDDEVDEEELEDLFVDERDSSVERMAEEEEPPV